MRVIIAGDFCPNNRGVKLVKDGSFDEIFGNVKQLLESADLSIVNFESCVNEHNAKPIIKQGPSLCTTSKTVEAVKYAGFDAVTLANNHFLDYGEQCVTETIESLDKAGIKHAGGGKNLDEASRPLYFEAEGKSVAIINCCEHEFSQASFNKGGSNPLNPIAQYYKIIEAKSKADKVIVIVHGGHEHYQLPSPRMVETYRFFVDCGADAVVNIHQHCFSGYETYKGCPIFYGLGNFYFDNPMHINGDKWNYGYMVTLDLNDDLTSFKIHPYCQCAEKQVIILLEENAFDEQIKELNTIIADSESLRKHTENYYEESSSLVEHMLNPYQNRFVRALVKYHVLPSLFTTKWLLKLYDYIMCESHRDKVEYYLSNKLKNK